MTNQAAKDYFDQGVRQVEAGRLSAAIDFFTKALNEDPDFLDAYRQRGEALIKAGKTEEGRKDLEKAEGKTKQTVEPAKKSKKVAVEKYNLHEVDDLWGSVLSEEGPDDSDLFGVDEITEDDSDLTDLLGGDYAGNAAEEEYEEDDLLYDDIYSGVDLGEERHAGVAAEPSARAEEYEQEYGDEYTGEYPDELLEEEREPEAAAEISGEEAIAVPEPVIAEEPEPTPPEPEEYSAVLEYIGGLRREVARARLFHPLENSLLASDDDNNSEPVFFEQLNCLRLSSLPKALAPATRRILCSKEIIETVDGSTYRELVHPQQNLENFLVCIPADEQAPYAYSLFPLANIKKRTNATPLTDILVKNRFISRVILQQAQKEFEQIKETSLEKIVAQKARVRLSEIEEAIQQAQQGPMQGMQKQEILLFSGLVDEQAIIEAVDQLERIKRLRIGQFLIEKRYVSEKQVYLSLAEKHNLPFMDLQGRKLSKMSLACLPRRMIVNQVILPLLLKDDVLVVATYFVDAAPLREKIMKTAGCKDVKFILSPPSQIREIINQIFGNRK